MLMPCINATTLNGEILKTTTTSIEVDEKSIEPINYGSIYGETYGLDGWAVYPLLGVHIEARIGDTVIGMGRSNIFANYRIRGLPIGYTYTIIASAPGYDIDKAEITLTSDEPHAKVNLGLVRNDKYAFQMMSKIKINQ
jgi:hypothetical protein